MNPDATNVVEKGLQTHSANTEAALEQYIDQLKKQVSNSEDSVNQLTAEKTQFETKQSMLETQIATQKNEIQDLTKAILGYQKKNNDATQYQKTHRGQTKLQKENRVVDNVDSSLLCIEELTTITCDVSVRLNRKARASEVFVCDKEKGGGARFTLCSRYLLKTFF
jgi:chromosome segregation ATPase